MSIAVRSFAKINIGLKIGPVRPDKFHELRTVYQTLALHDVLTIEARPGDGIEIHCPHPGVPTGDTNICWRVAEAARAGRHGGSLFQWRCRDVRS